MATICPLCGKGTLKVGEKMVYCSERIIKRDGKDFFNDGECDFHIGFKQKIFGRDLTPKDIKALVEGKTIKNKKGDVLRLDLENTEFFTSIDFAERPEDKDL